MKHATLIFALAFCVAPAYAQDAMQDYNGVDLTHGGAAWPPFYGPRVKNLAIGRCRAMLAANVQHYLEDSNVDIPAGRSAAAGSFVHKYFNVCIEREQSYLADMARRCGLLAAGHMDEHGRQDNSAYTVHVEHHPDAFYLYCLDRRLEQYARTGSYDPVPGTDPYNAPITVR